MPEPAMADPTAALIRAPTSLVPSPGTDTITRCPTRTASSGTACGIPLGATTTLLPCGDTAPAGLRVSS